MKHQARVSINAPSHNEAGFCITFWLVLVGAVVAGIDARCSYSTTRVTHDWVINPHSPSYESSALTTTELFHYPIGNNNAV